MLQLDTQCSDIQRFQVDVGVWGALALCRLAGYRQEEEEEEEDARGSSPKCPKRSTSIGPSVLSSLAW